MNCGRTKRCSDKLPAFAQHRLQQTTCVSRKTQSGTSCGSIQRKGHPGSSGGRRIFELDVRTSAHHAARSISKQLSLHRGLSATQSDGGYTPTNSTLIRLHRLREVQRALIGPSTQVVSFAGTWQTQHAGVRHMEYIPLYSITSLKIIMTRC